MTQQELKRLSRAELLDIILLQIKENKELQEEVALLREQLDNRMITIKESGNIAESALRLNNIFQDAEKAVEQYKENIRRISEEQNAMFRQQIDDMNKNEEQISREIEERVKERIKEQTLKKISKIIGDAKNRADEIISDAQRVADGILADANMYVDYGKQDVICCNCAFLLVKQTIKNVWLNFSNRALIHFIKIAGIK